MSEAVVVLPFVPVTPTIRARVRRRKSSTSLSCSSPRRSASASRLAQPGLGGREARRDRRRGDEQVGGVHRLGQRGRVDAEEQLHPAPVERRDGVGELGGGAAVVGRHERAGIGQKAGRRHPGACQPQDERAAPGQVGAAANRSGRGGHGHAL